MFEKYGEFDSAEELNEAAKGQMEEGDYKAVFEIAEENGIDKEDAQDFLDGVCGELATPLMAALGKLDMEVKEMELYEIAQDWLVYIKIRCEEEEAMARAVRRKGKCLEGCIAAILQWSFKHQHPVDRKILKAAGVTVGRCTLGIPGMATAKEIITEYYLGKQV